MSAFSTIEITREEAEEKVLKILMKEFNFRDLSNYELFEKLNQYAYSEEHTDILGVLNNFRNK